MKALAVALVFAACPALADVTVTDGDSLEIAGERIRLYGIDAPEHAQTCPDGWPAGQEATAFLTGLVAGRTVECRLIERDRYDRAVSVCYAGGDDLSAAMVSAGMALAFVRFTRRYVDAERRAAGKGKGVHAHDCHAPWEWRARQRQ